jgi:hypothetical protein
MLDAIDLHLRGPEASIDLTTHADYAEKLRFTALYESLDQHKSLEAIKAERTPTESVGALLQQLGHDVAGLFTGEDKADDVALGNNPAAAVRPLRAIADRLQGATAQLAQRAVARDQHAAPQISPQALDQLMARVAEQASVISLNVAIEAARAPQGSSLGEMGTELHAMAIQLHKARADMAALMATAAPMVETVPTVPLSFAIDALTSAESALREYIDGAHAPTAVDEAA